MTQIQRFRNKTLLQGMLNKIEIHCVNSGFSEGRVCEISRTAKCIKLKHSGHVDGNA
jgi:hypothetical protein